MGALMRIQEMAQDGLTEFGGSMDDFISRVRSEFDRQMRPAGPLENMEPSPYVTDVFPDHCIVRAGDRYLQVSITVSEEAIEFAPRADWKPVALQYVAEMPLSAMREVMVVSEFKGKYPTVPLADGVDYDALVDGDDDPVFVTLPIGKANVTSGNKRHYDAAFVTELERQVLANRPVGLMGHLKPEQRATEFPMEAVHWVGAKRIGEYLWGKGYVPAGDARARLKRYKATNKSIATSIDALAEGVWDEKLGAYRMKAKSLRLNQIDIAPADRAGIGDLAAVPRITTEMASAAHGRLAEADASAGNDSNSNQKEGPDMDRDEVLRGLTAADVDALPSAVRDTISANAVQEMRTELGLAEGVDVAAHVRELQETEATRQQEAVAQRIRELVEDEEKGVKLESARGLVTELVVARQPQTAEEAQTAYDEVVASENVQTLLGERVQETMGPNQTNGLQSQSGGHRYFQIPADGVPAE